MVVENPLGTAGKFEMNTDLGLIELNRTRETPMLFPFEYGFIPRTWSEGDDDPVDIMTILPTPTFPGCVLNVRVIGMFKLLDSGEKDNKILAVCDADESSKDIKELSDMPPALLEKIAFFWENYKDLEPGSRTEGQGWSSREAAMEFIEKSIQTYLSKFSSND